MANGKDSGGGGALKWVLIIGGVAIVGVIAYPLIAGAGSVLGAAGDAVGFAVDVAEDIWDGVKKIGEYAEEFIDWCADKFAAMWDWLSDVGSWIADGLADIGDSLLGWLD